ncbi:MAG: hypothetical protein QUV05_20920 [Phycisphaerae bacterium]|nr:hypothetical protein [Phycisphaerae bacterium]
MPAKRARKPKTRIDPTYVPANELAAPLSADDIGSTVDPELLRRLVSKSDDDFRKKLCMLIQNAKEARDRGDHGADAGMIRAALCTAKEWQARAKEDRRTGWDAEGDLASYDEATEMADAVQALCDQLERQRAEGLDDKLSGIDYKLNSLREILVLASATEGSKSKDTEATGEVLAGEEKAIGLRLRHPEWSHPQIAEAVPCGVRTLHTWPKYKVACAAVKKGKAAFPRGQKDGETSDLEAWEE